MGDYLFFIIFGVIFVIFFVFMIIYIIRQEKSVIERARKIDPSVKTGTEARFVLQKDIAKDFGSGKNNNNNN